MPTTISPSSDSPFTPILGRALLGVTILLTASDYFAVAQADDREAPDYILEYAERSNKERFAARAITRKLIADAKINLSKVKRERFDSEVQKRSAVESAQSNLDSAIQELAAIEDPFEPYYAKVDPKELMIGAIGRIDWGDAYVKQVIDRENLLVEFAWSVRVMKSLDSTSAATRDNVYESSEERSMLVWVCGIDTSNLVNKKSLTFQGVNPNEVFETTRSETYPTRGGGSNSVPVLERVDTEPYASLFDESRKLREWKDKSGKHSFEAVFAKLERGKVRLIGPDRKPRDVDLNLLSEADQSYIQEQLRQQRKAMKAAEE